MVSTRITYILWFFFGWAGMHHLYLGRLNHAILWFATLGGGCGLGWIRDYWRIPEYIKWCNPDKSARKYFLSRASSNSKPVCSRFRQTGMTIMGYLTSTILSALVPDYSDLSETDPVTFYFSLCVKECLRVLGNTVGVCLVANTGEFKCSPFYPFVTSVCTVPFFSYVGSVALASSITTHVTKDKGIRWRQVHQASDKSGCRKICFNVCIYSIVCVTWMSIIATGFYLNGSSIFKTEETSEGGQSTKGFFHSKEMVTLANAIKNITTIIQNIGIKQTLKEIWSSMDFTETLLAYKTLGVFPGTDQDKISKICRKLLAENHPDRFKLPAEREEAQLKFIDIHKACSAISITRQQQLRDEN